MYVKVIEDSVSEYGHRMTTLETEHPRFVHADFMTHRVFSRNASSSRAIPVARQIRRAKEAIVEPIRYGLNQPGMQASEECLTGEALERARFIWHDMAEYVMRGCQELAELGLHKQWANRPTEWFSNICVVVSSTNWDNFFELRDHSDAQPEIQVEARSFREALAASKPKLLKPGQWHLPYVSARERVQLEHDIATLKGISTARNARVSYMTHDGKTPSADKDMALYDRLVGSRPLHASPAEHVATPDRKNPDGSWCNPHLHGNLEGWIQHRKELEIIHWNK